MSKKRIVWLVGWIYPLRHIKSSLKVTVGALCSIAGSIVATWLVTKSKLWDLQGTPLLNFLMPLFFLIMLLTVIITLSFLADALKKRQDLTAEAPCLTPAQTLRNRERMRHRLVGWYQQFLEASLMQAAWLDLDLTDTPDAIDTPVSLVFQEAPMPEHPLVPGTTIIQVYNEAGQELLVLGEPGAGKSTLLYHLAQYLLQRTETDQTAPLPIVFALSTWPLHKAPLEQWMVEQLVHLYHLPRTLAQHWVATQAILPLLDGLDEMEEAARPRCIAAINAYHQIHQAPLVVCSRSAEYATAAQIHQLALPRAVVVQPLSEQQITNILTRGGRSLAGLRAAYKDNLALHGLLASPLFLNLFLLSYRGVSIRTLPTTTAALQQQVFERYVQQMLMRKGDQHRYPASRMRFWLMWLAQQMHQRQMAHFGIENLQPDWLAARFQWRYRLSAILLVGLLGGLLGGLIFGLALGPVSGFAFGAVSGLVFGPLGGLLTRPMSKKQPSIRLAERLQWSRSASRSGLVSGLILGLVSGLLGGLVFGLINKQATGLLLGLLGGLVFGLLFGLAFGLLGGVQPAQIIGRDAFSPGEGISRSLKNGLVVGILFGLPFGMLFGLLLGLVVGILFGLHFGILFGLLFGLIVGPISMFVFGLTGGLDAFLQHLCLRFWLWRDGKLPWHLVPFLDDACARSLLKQVGGRYQFLHALLQDYFTGL